MLRTPTSSPADTSQPGAHPRPHTTDGSRSPPVLPGSPPGPPPAGAPRQSRSQCALSSAREPKAMRQRGQAKAPAAAIGLLQNTRARQPGPAQRPSLLRAARTDLLGDAPAVFEAAVAIGAGHAEPRSAPASRPVPPGSVLWAASRPSRRSPPQRNSAGFLSQLPPQHSSSPGRVSSRCPRAGAADVGRVPPHTPRSARRHFRQGSPQRRAGTPHWLHLRLQRSALPNAGAEELTERPAPPSCARCPPRARPVFTQEPTAAQCCLSAAAHERLSARMRGRGLLNSPSSLAFVALFLTTFPIDAGGVRGGVNTDSCHRQKRSDRAKPWGNTSQEPQRCGPGCHYTHTRCAWRSSSITTLCCPATPSFHNPSPDPQPQPNTHLPSDPRAVYQLNRH